MAEGFSAIFSQLNENQKKAVEATAGPLIVLAGAGSGKTRVIAHRIANIVNNGTPPSRILAVTFTNKAAREMKDRIAALLTAIEVPTKAGLPFVGTFHRLGAYILKMHGSRMGINKHFSILDPEDVLKIYKELIQEFALDPDLYDPARFRNIISRMKNELQPASIIAEQLHESPFEEVLSRIYIAYEARLQKTQSVDFDDLLIKPVELLSNYADIRAYWENEWSYMHVDEYQDTNRAQYILSKQLAARHGNICVVGDIDQAIYSWRGADWRNILNFEQDFPNSMLIALEENYRSTKFILEAAHHVIARNTERKDLRLRTENPEGERLRIRVLEDEKHEAAMITDDIMRALKEGIPPNEIAVLFRTNAQSRAIEEAFIQHGVRYHLVAGTRFYERKEIKDVLAYLALARNPEQLMMKRRIINVPTRGIGKILVLKHFSGAPLSTSESKKIQEFEELMNRIRSVSRQQPISETVRFVIDEAGLKRGLEPTPEGKERGLNMDELITVAKKFDEMPPESGFDAFMEEVALMSDQDVDDHEGVQLMTAHAAKGLEFRLVFIAGMEEGLFPHALSTDEGKLEEERRLFYVSLTRARERVIISLASRRLLYGELSFNEPSRFLSEIPEHVVEISVGETTASPETHYIDYGN